MKYNGHGNTRSIRALSISMMHINTDLVCHDYISLYYSNAFNQLYSINILAKRKEIINVILKNGNNLANWCDHSISGVELIYHCHYHHDRTVMLTVALHPSSD